MSHAPPVAGNVPVHPMECDATLGFVQAAAGVAPGGNGMNFQMMPPGGYVSSQVVSPGVGGAGGMCPANAVATAAVAAAAPPPNTVKLSKTLLCEIKGTMNAFSVMGPNAASWKPLEGKHATIFGVDEGFDSMAGTGSDVCGGAGNSMLLNADLAAATNALRNVTITKATLLQCYNTFGVPLGVTISCLPKNESVDTGDKYTFTTIPGASVNTPSTLYEAGDTHAQAMEWMRNFGKFNSSNLSTEGVMKVPPLLFVLARACSLGPSRSDRRSDDP